MGSHATGKTTLCRHISKDYSVPMITETARSVLAELEAPLMALRTDLSLVDRFQQEVMLRQIDIEKKIKGSFVSDRAFDSLAYAAEHSTILGSLVKSPEVKDYIQWVKQGVVFFVRPDKALLQEDGVRETPTWESVLRIDGMVKLLLELFEVDYLPIHPVSMQERIKLVNFVLKQYKKD